MGNQQHWGNSRQGQDGSHRRDGGHRHGNGNRGHGGHHGQGGQDDLMMRAPFRFAPVNRRVFFPDWADQVSHDVPFADGFSGEICFDIEAETPVLVGGPRRKAGGNAPGEVWPVMCPDGSWAIPGSALRGMVRSVLEVASFANLAPFVRDRRYAVREIAPNPTSKLLYTGRLTEKPRDVIYPRTRAGWMIRDREGVTLVPCDLARIHVEQLAAIARSAGRPDPLAALTVPSEAHARYRAFLGNPANKGALDVNLRIDDPTDHRHTDGLIHYRRAFQGGNKPATIVLTGKTNRGIGPRQKKYDFAFFGPDRATARQSGSGSMRIESKVWRDFLLIHEPPTDSGQKINPNWEYWKPDFESGLPIPIFWLEGKDGPGHVGCIGTAFMFKLAMPLGTHDLLRNSSEDHRLDGPPDLPSLIFGSVAGEAGKGLKRRASFDWARATLPPGKELERRKAILLAPKPSYYPFYVRQPDCPQNRLPHGTTWAVYMNQKGGGTERQVPESAGVKLYPAHADGVRIPEPPGDNVNPVSNILNALPAGTRFDGCRLRFHNLKPVEIGALLWALTHGDPKGRQGLRHRLGMGKPLGFGMITVRLSSVRLLPNGDVPANLSIDDLLGQFETTMDTFHGAAGGGPWRDSLQIRTLRKSASPGENRGLDLQYAGRRGGDYRVSPQDHAALKKEGIMLPPYETGGEIPRGGARGQAAASASPRPTGDVASRIIVDTSSDPRRRMAMLEAGYDAGKANDPLLEATIRQSRDWEESDRILLARLVRDKARPNNRLGFKWKQLEPLLVQLPD